MVGLVAVVRLHKGMPDIYLLIYPQHGPMGNNGTQSNVHRYTANPVIPKGVIRSIEIY